MPLGEREQRLLAWSCEEPYRGRFCRRSWREHGNGKDLDHLAKIGMPDDKLTSTSWVETGSLAHESSILYC
jgi:hypothetical protein